MIWGKTHQQRKDAKPKIGGEKVIFAILPRQLPDGRWACREYLRVKWEDAGFGAEWAVQGIDHCRRRIT